MEANENIEREIEKVLSAGKNIKPVDLPEFYTERTMQRIASAKPGRSNTVYAMLKIAAAVILICVNAYTVSYLFESPAPQQPEQTNASIDDLVNDYQVADIGNADWLNNKTTTQNEQQQAH